MVKRRFRCMKSFNEMKMWDMEFAIEIGRMREAAMMKESYDNGYKQGIITVFQSQIMEKYGLVENKWLENLTLRQLRKVTEEILKEITLDELRNRVEIKK